CPSPAQRRAINERLNQAKLKGAVLIDSDGGSAILAAPIRNSAGSAVAALSIAIPSGRAEAQFVQLCLGKLSKAAQQLVIGSPLCSPRKLPKKRRISRSRADRRHGP